mgnify:CR=1 FL=1
MDQWTHVGIARAHVGITRSHTAFTGKTTVTKHITGSQNAQTFCEITSEFS